MADSKMTRAERDDLIQILKGRRRVAKHAVDQRAAELLADFEQQLATEYKIDATAWKDLTTAANLAVKAADHELARRCRELGIPEHFRPGLSLSWYNRGENADRQRRVELRRVAETRIAALAKAALTAIETKALDGQERLVQGALESAEAQAFMASMPTVEMLMPSSMYPRSPRSRSLDRGPRRKTASRS